MKNNITELCALLWAMHTPESKNNPGLDSALTELHKLVFGKAQANAIQEKINSILKAYTFLETPYIACQQALTRQKDNDGLYQALMVDANGVRNQPPPKKTPMETYKDKGGELDNIAVEIADHLKNCYSPDGEEKANAQKAIKSLKVPLNL
ncbi:hypothetical protein [Candidatus Parabeggiatoa sp. HSG14]|uniref:hypothetical protein n=1 Tax=Candidatus Parabeggiatoa sp. HSG14 TaxID=3055593 RepID=UPI0025A8B18F|nr:hypothetical protein [Thiotrichales bacterium HSG14]